MAAKLGEPASGREMGVEESGSGHLRVPAGEKLDMQCVAALIFGVSSLDVATYGGVAALITPGTAVACIVPAHRAARADPLEALKAE